METGAVDWKRGVNGEDWLVGIGTAVSGKMRVKSGQRWLVKAQWRAVVLADGRRAGTGWEQVKTKGGLAG